MARGLKPANLVSSTGTVSSYSPNPAGASRVMITVIFIHRGDLHELLLAAVKDRLGPDTVHMGHVVPG